MSLSLFSLSNWDRDRERKKEKRRLITPFPFRYESIIYTQATHLIWEDNIEKEELICVTFFPLSGISHLQFDFLDLSSSLLLNDDKTVRKETTFFFSSKVFGMKKRRDHFKTGDKRIMSFLSQRRKKRINKKKMDWLLVYFNDQF
jgi:hypothetical protein